MSYCKPIDRYEERIIKHNKNWHPDNIRPPQKTIKGKFKTTKRVYSEVHDAIWSGGRKNRTHRLSNSEFYRQIGEEAGYLFAKSGSYFAEAGRDFCKLLRALFS